MTAFLAQPPVTLAFLLLAMTLVAWMETVLPLQLAGSAARIRVRANLVITAITFATNFLLNLGLAAVLVIFRGYGFGLLNRVSLPAVWSVVIVVITLDFSFYVAHVAMHKIPAFWKYHRVHHSDTMVDATTAFRQHPGESVLRQMALAAAALTLGADPVSFAAYRFSSALNAIFEHANLRAPRWLDRGLSLLTTWPHMHKVHHSRLAQETDTNYGNLLSIWDRLFGTFTPSDRGRDVRYGLDDFDDAHTQSVAGLMGLPFRP